DARQSRRAIGQVRGLQRQDRRPLRPGRAVMTRTFTVIALLFTAGGALAADSPLADAAEKADWAKVKALLALKADVAAGQADGMTALHWAAYHDNADFVTLLLKAGAPAKAENMFGVTPLALACTNGNAEIVKSLLAAGADANATLKGG